MGIFSGVEYLGEIQVIILNFDQIEIGAQFWLRIVIVINEVISNPKSLSLISHMFGVFLSKHIESILTTFYNYIF